MPSLNVQLVLTSRGSQWCLILQRWIKLLLDPALNALECFLTEAYLNWEAKELMQLAWENSCLTLEPRFSGALTPNRNAHQCVVFVE